jgi:beta-lactamase regulating signal transducer with metallopeptidase domain
MVEAVCDALLRVNLVAAAAILAVLALRRPVRHAFGPEIAYRLWAAPPLAAFGTLVPLKTVATGPVLLRGLAPASLAPGLLILWLAGVAVTVACMALAQHRFLKAARAGRSGPAVTGFISARLIMPPDDGRYRPEERELIRVHERTHIDRGDPRAAGLMAAFQALAWFNPLAHIAVRAARLDQELACDRAVVRRYPARRALYAETLLKTQLAGQPLPLGCQWPARGRHPLEVRVALLQDRVPRDGVAGPLMLGGVLTAAVALAWAAEPPLRPHAPIVLAWDAPETTSMSVMIVRWPKAR